ncbi:MAG TPA: SDR family NAD(P)-dependent oxidoreductase [Polyangiaceae bacterium]|nr:SDR family NAD(P)-dependent oxidoreductase [Polyangiaceae bacterium]
MSRLQGRRVVLTGASRGVGRETVKLFSQEGAEIIGVARDAAKLAALAQQYPGFQAVVGDITDRGLGARIAQAVTERWGAFDLLINNAAIQEFNAGFHAEPLDALERNITTNVLSAHWLTHALLPLLKLGKEPRIINVSSGAGKLDAVKAEPNMPAYRLSKLLLNGLSISYAGDLKGQVAVNSLDPGWLKTDLGGPNAPGEPPDGAVRMLELACKPFSVTGGFWYGAEPIDF